ncbi:MAG TPA: hypothetical protein VGD77_04340 [Gemmatimonadaceae bacterium]
MHARLRPLLPAVASAATATFDAAVAAIVGSPAAWARRDLLGDWHAPERYGYIVMNAVVTRSGHRLPLRAVSRVFTLGRGREEGERVLRESEAAFEGALRARFEGVEITFRALDGHARRDSADRARLHALRNPAFAMFLEIDWGWGGGSQGAADLPSR